MPKVVFKGAQRLSLYEVHIYLRDLESWENPNRFPELFQNWAA